jgi:hypothetical protein
MTMKSILMLGAGFGVALASLDLTAFSTQAGAAEVPKEIIAVQIRKQGYKCVNPQSAERAGETPLDDSRWILRCDNATYRVTLVPNMAAMVETLAKDDSAENSGQAH